MITRLFSDPRRLAVLRRVDRPAAILLAIAQALVAAAGWFVEPLWLAVAVAAQLLLGGIVAIRVIGPARSDLGLARYAIPATAGIAATLFGRLIPGGLSLLLVPIVAVLLWSVTYLELRLERGTGGRTIGELLLTSILFCGAAGILERFGPALLHLLAVVQVGVAVVLLNLWPTIMAGIMALTFYAWGGAADMLRGSASGRSVAVEFGTLLLFGLVLGLILHRP